MRYPDDIDVQQIFCSFICTLSQYPEFPLSEQHTFAQLFTFLLKSPLQQNPSLVQLIFDALAQFSLKHTQFIHILQEHDFDSALQGLDLSIQSTFTQSNVCHYFDRTYNPASPIMALPFELLMSFCFSDDTHLVANAMSYVVTLSTKSDNSVTLSPIEHCWNFDWCCRFINSLGRSLGSLVYQRTLEIVCCIVATLPEEQKAQVAAAPELVDCIIDNAHSATDDEQDYILTIGLLGNLVNAQLRFGQRSVAEKVYTELNDMLNTVQSDHPIVGMVTDAFQQLVSNALGLNS